MPLDKNVKEQLIEKYRVTENDTGSSEVQISLLTSRINSLTDHLRNNKHDQSSKRCLLYTSPSPRDGLLSRMPSSA